MKWCIRTRVIYVIRFFCAASDRNRIRIAGYRNGLVPDFSRPCKPTDYGVIGSFNGNLQAECLNTREFLSLDDARAKMKG
jgi:transposase InsO family protein